MSTYRQYRQPYNPDKIDLIRKKLEMCYQKETPLYYKILVDGVCVVEQTTNLSEFDSFEKYFTPTTREVEIQVYTSNPQSPWHVKHIFDLIVPEDLYGNFSGMSDKETSMEIVNNRIAINKLEGEIERLTDKLDQAKQKIKKRDKKIEKLEAKLEEKEQQVQSNSSFDKFGSLVETGITSFAAAYQAKNGKQTKDDSQLSGDDEGFEVNEEVSEKEENKQKQKKKSKPRKSANLNDFTREELEDLDELMYYFKYDKKHIKKLLNHFKHKQNQTSSKKADATDKTASKQEANEENKNPKNHE